MSERFRTVAWRVARGLAAVVLLCLGAAVVGFAVGPDPGVRSAPAVDTDERPSEVVADAATRLWVRDHTWELWVREQDRATESATKRIVWRVRVQHSRSRFRVVVWDDSEGPNGTVHPSDPPMRYGYSRRYAAWGRIPEEDDWRRYSGIEPVYEPKRSAPVTTVSGLRNASMTVVSENETALVVRTSDERALSALRSDFRRGEVTATFVVAKTEDPHLARYTVRKETNETVVVTTVQVSAVGTTTALKPEGVPPITPMEFVRRTVFGLEALFT